MKLQCILLASVLALGIAGVAQATPVATLHNVRGTVLVNQGERFVPAKPGMVLDVGDRVLLMDDARARVEYAQGCSLPLAPNSAATITARCLVMPNGMMQAVGSGDQNHDRRKGAAIPLPATTSPPNYTPALIIGGVVLVAALAAGGGGGGSQPISP